LEKEEASTDEYKKRIDKDGRKVKKRDEGPGKGREWRRGKRESE